MSFSQLVSLSQLLSFSQRQTVVSNQLGLIFAMERRFSVRSQYIARHIATSYPSYGLSEQEVHSYVHQLVFEKKAAWIYQDQTLGFFQAIGHLLPPPPLNTPFRLL